MRGIRLGRLVLILPMLMLPLALLRAAAPQPGAPAESASLAGQLLIASPEIGDPRFRHTVILMVRHNREGALGIVINRPVEERSLASLLEAIGESGKGVEGSVRIFAGGPVEPAIGLILHTSDYHRSGTIDIDGRVAMTTSPGILKDIGAHKGPQKSLVAFGYAGWAAGQLEHELARHDWFTAPEDPKLIFDDDRDQVWDDAMARRTLDL
ncbi:MAG: YqgE/AlgH family protein [Alphaproteobacteria bacterium]